MISST